jgi:ATP-dependent RNA circularization protein (DNA/RNA ligase family)
MTTRLHKFPSTPHLAWLGTGPVRGDKVFTSPELSSFLDQPLIVEEKLDGANLGISLAVDGELRFQNRGNWLEGKLSNQWERLRHWGANHLAALQAFLPPNHILFGEWCYARHSVTYNRLPDWFIAFDVVDCGQQRFWSTIRRDRLLAELGLAVVPQIATGRFTLAELAERLKAPGAFSSEPREGLYLRLEGPDWLTDRAKLVRSSFTQQITEHWSSRPLEKNELAIPVPLMREEEL